ncbi:MAG: GAF domain-containing protein [Chloroflexi bacterium]|nr:GAF domain-containing protein [Chloroflexota bacterium]
MARLPFLNLLSWPLWLKLTVGFTLAIVLPALLITAISQSGFNQINTEHIRLYVSENGAHQQEAISTALNQAAALLDEFVNDEAHQQQIDLALDEEIDGIRSRIVANRFRSNLFNSGLFTLVRLLNAEGRIIAASNALETLPPGTSNAESLAYVQAKEAFANGISFLTSVQASGVLEITHVISRSGVPVGYLIGRIDTEGVILEPLRLSGNVYNAYSYLMTGGSQPTIFSLRETRQLALQASVDSQAVARALAGTTKTDTYRLGGGQAHTVIGFYGPIPDPTRPGTPLFALVVEANAVPYFVESLAQFSGPRAFTVIVGAMAVLVIMVLLFHQFIAPPLHQLRVAVQGMSRGEFSLPVETRGRKDEIGQLSSSFVEMRDQIQTLLQDLESRIAARSRDLTAMHEVSRFAVTQRNLQTLLDEVVNLIVTHFPSIYHAQIFLLDTDETYAVLRASTGEVGRTLLQRGHRLAVGSLSVIGQVTQQGEVVVARDTTSSQVHRHNEFLPYTRAELAIPLKVGDRVIGALDVQSKQRNAFTQDEIGVLQTMADQLAVAIENARLYQDSMRRMAEIDRANREATRTTWQEYIYSQRRRSLSSEAGIPTGTDVSALRQQAVREGRIVVGEVGSNGTIPIAVPIQLSGQTLGAVEWELPAEQLDDNKLQLAQELANRLAISLDNARLFEESQRAAERERIVNTIAARLTPQTEINEILQTAVREVGQALRAPQVSIRLSHTNGKHEQK